MQRNKNHAHMNPLITTIYSVRRVILASSNHVMGGYKDLATHGPSSVRPSSDPLLGTVPLNAERVAESGDAVAYAAAKLAGERLAISMGRMHGSTTTFVVLRIGWCQPGENSPATLTAAGSPPEFLSGATASDGGGVGGGDGGKSSSSVAEENDRQDELWFKRMWLSNPDFLRYFESAIHLDVPTEEPHSGGDGDASDGGAHRNVRKGYVLVNAMSRNSGAKWNLEETERLLGVVSTDDSLAS